MDNFGNVIEPTHDLDLEYVYPPKSERICAQDERFASVNEAIGRIEYNLEQHITQCADGLAPLADFITSCWAVMDEVIDRVAKLEAAQPKPVPDAYAHIPIAEWLDFKEELEALRKQRAVMDDDGVLLAHDAWEAVEREIAELQAFKASVPWVALESAVNGAANAYAAPLTDIDAASAWLAANAPKGGAE